MTDLFDSQSTASGYARSRPPLHPLIFERILARLGITRRLALGLDVGCGAGLSTAPLSEIAAFTIGVEPSAAMLAQSSAVAPKASFIAGTAEALPIRSHAVDLATAAGSLNWVDLKRFFPEAVRVLQADGTLVVYDYHPGRDFLRSDLLTDWYSEFVRRFPPPPCFEIHPDRLGCEPYGLQIRDRENFEIGLSMTPGSYLEYVLTEIGVIQAIQGGTDPLAIRTWCENTLSLVFRKHSREVLFRGFIVYLKPA